MDYRKMILNLLDKVEKEDTFETHIRTVRVFVSQRIKKKSK